VKTIREASLILDLDMALVAADLAIANAAGRPGDYLHPAAQVELADLSEPQRAELGRRIMMGTHGQR
jgi:hypothetical protein